MNLRPLKQLRILAHRHLIKFGIDLRKKRKDRVVLEKQIFPELLRNPRYQSILFVGCAWYTLHYPSLFRNRNFVTMEISQDEAQYGGSRHIIDSCEHIDRHFPAGTLDAVILNGVYGFGLNQLNAIQTTLSQIYQALSPSGLFVFGWNDLPATAPYPIQELTELNKFTPYTFPPLQSSVYESDPKNRHRFHFYLKES